MQLDSKQIEAIELCLNKTNRIVAITGAAGTGKTTIIRQVAKRLEDDGISFALAAPTGKAARRITQATGYEAVTCHRLLEYPRPGERDPDTGKALAPGVPKRDHKNPLSQSVIIVDEYAMVPHELNRNIIDALDRGARLLVFGDINQLPPIEQNKIVAEQPTPFEEHLERASVTLEHVYRQDEDGGILTAANRIRRGQLPNRTKDFVLDISTQQLSRIKDHVVSMKENHGIDFGKIENQIIAPSKGTWVGTHALNRVLRDLLNPFPEKSSNLPRHSWEKEISVLQVSVGDKVVCTENMYDLRDYTTRFTEWTNDGNPVDSSFVETPPNKMMLNGETGIIVDITEDGVLFIETDDRTVEFPPIYNEWSYKNKRLYEVYPQKSIDLAYALTTHKCQGSEYQRVVYAISRSMFYMLNRKNFYTAVTRAKEHVIVFCDQQSLQGALGMGVKK